MELQRDFSELLTLFNAHGVDYMVVGGYALAFHGAPRFTGDLDLFVKPDENNARKVVQALDEFGFGSIGLTAADFLTTEKVVQLGVPPVRVDIVTSITGVAWDDAAHNRVEGRYGDVTVSYIGKNDFIANKKSLGRHKDIADIEALGEKTD